VSFSSSFKDIFDWKGIKVKLSSNFVLIWRQIDKEFEILGQNLVLIITMDTRPVITFGVFGGGVSGHQVSAFCTTFAQVQLSFATRVSLRLNLITNKLVHERNMSEEEVFQQLHEADVYLILGHMHQGNPQWSAITVLDLLSVLQCSSKIGWPQRRHLTCPVFTQDKGRYIEKCRVVTIPTLKLNFGEDQLGELLDFVSKHEEGNGWVLKLPFTTNAEGIKFCKSPQAIIDEADRHAKNFGHRMSYSLLQPCLANRKEYKVVIVDGRASYVADINQRSTVGKAFSVSPHSELKIFAEKVCEIFETFCDDGLILPMFRVDIMQTKSGLVVNEMESLEACYFSKKFDKFELQTTDLIRTFWLSTIEMLVTEALG
jgi:hypothetical protein